MVVRTLVNVFDESRDFTFPVLNTGPKTGTPMNTSLPRLAFGALSFDGSPWGQVTIGAHSKHSQVRRLMHAAYSAGDVWILPGLPSWANLVSLSGADDKPAQYMACTRAVEARLHSLFASIVRMPVVDNNKLLTQHFGEWGVSTRNPVYSQYLQLQWDLKRFNQNQVNIWTGAWSKTRHTLYHFVGSETTLRREHVHANDVIVRDGNLTHTLRGLDVVRPAHRGMSSIERAKYFMQTTFSPVEHALKPQARPGVRTAGVTCTLASAWMPELAPVPVASPAVPLKRELETGSAPTSVSKRHMTLLTALQSVAFTHRLTGAPCFPDWLVGARELCELDKSKAS